MSIDWYDEDGRRPETPEGDLNSDGLVIWKNVPQEVLNLLPADGELEALLICSGFARGLREQEDLRLLCAYARASYLDPKICKGCGCSELKCELKCCPDCTHGRHLASLEQLERAQIQKVVALFPENKSRAAQILGIDRRTLYRKLKQYAVQAAKRH